MSISAPARCWWPAHRVSVSNLNVNGRLTNFAPRVGIAYQLTPKTVIRAGYGRGYDLGIFGSIFGQTSRRICRCWAFRSVAAGQQFRHCVHAGAGPDAARPARRSGVAAQRSERLPPAAQRRDSVRDHQPRAASRPWTPGTSPCSGNSAARLRWRRPMSATKARTYSRAPAAITIPIRPTSSVSAHHHESAQAVLSEVRLEPEPALLRLGRKQQLPLAAGEGRQAILKRIAA